MLLGGVIPIQPHRPALLGQGESETWLKGSTGWMRQAGLNLAEPDSLCVCVHLFSRVDEINGPFKASWLLLQTTTLKITNAYSLSDFCNF